MISPSPQIFATPAFDRGMLAEEFHARPPLPVTAPADIYVWALQDPVTTQTDKVAACNRNVLAALATGAGINHTPQPDDDSFCLLHNADAQIKFERHTEFSSFVMMIRAQPGTDPFVAEIPAFIPSLLRDNDRLLTALRIHIIADTTPAPDERRLRQLLQADDFVGTSVSGGRGQLWTDFRIKDDGFGRILLQDQGMSPRRAGRLIQRLIDIETYRMLAMLGLPLVRTITPMLEQLEQDVIDITGAMAHKSAADDDLLDRLVYLASRHEHLVAFGRRRFAATAAYRALVERRLNELREERIEGLQRVSVFIERRFGPAMRTIESCDVRQRALTKQISRSTELLRTRVDVALEAQNQALLHSMDQRTAHQLRLQEAVEGLSLFAISYYVLGLVKYGAETLAKLGIDINPKIVPGLLLPLVFIMLLIGRRWLSPPKHPQTQEKKPENL